MKKSPPKFDPDAIADQYYLKGFATTALIKDEMSKCI